MLSMLQVGSRNRTVGPVGAGGVSEWDGRRWTVDGRDELQLQEEAKQRFRQRFRGSSSNTSTNTSHTNSTTAGGGLSGGWVPAQVCRLY